MSKPNAHGSAQPHVLIAIVAAVGVSFVAGEAVGVRIAETHGEGARASVTARGEAPTSQAQPTTREADPPDVVEASGIPADCNTNYR
jgi:hypothetical protein